MNVTELTLTIISMVGGSIVIGVSGAFVWFKASKGRIYKRIEEVERALVRDSNQHSEWHLENSGKLVALQKDMTYIERALEDIKLMAAKTSDSGKKTSESIEKLLRVLVSRKNGDNGHDI